MRRRVVGPASVAAGAPPGRRRRGRLRRRGVRRRSRRRPPPTATTSTAAAETTTTARRRRSCPPGRSPACPPTTPRASLQPAIVVKVDNSPEARPHAGINQADIVYELQVEGITRFMEVFHSQDARPHRPGPLGPQQRHQPAEQPQPPAAALVGWQPRRDQRGARAPRTTGCSSTSSTAARPTPSSYRDGTPPAGTSRTTLFVNAVGIRTNFTPEDASPPQAVFARRAAGETLPADRHRLPGHHRRLRPRTSGSTTCGTPSAAAGTASRSTAPRPGRHARSWTRPASQVAPPNVVILNLPYEMSGSSPGGAVGRRRLRASSSPRARRS